MKPELLQRPVARAATVAAVALTVALSFASAPSAPAQLGRQQGLLEANTAAEGDLAKLPHFDPAKAKALAEARPFLSAAQLQEFLAKSLSAEQVTEVYGKLFLHINLNTASREEILLVPGMGPRIAHEFEEYRPYKNLAQFRKEIGKYVDEKEVARLEQYVFIPVDLNSASDEDILSIPGMGPKMLHEFKEYRPYKTIEQFRKEIGKYVDEKEVARLERYVAIGGEG
jgi:DNA uptake protein ComE-like DNA-binding protein